MKHHIYKLFENEEQIDMPPLPVDVENALSNDTEMKEIEFDSVDDTPMHNTTVEQMTIGEFLKKCDDINPLVCIGLNKFIEDNHEALTATSDTQLDMPVDDTPMQMDAGDDLDQLDFTTEEPTDSSMDDDMNQLQLF